MLVKFAGFKSKWPLNLTDPKVYRSRKTVPVVFLQRGQIRVQGKGRWRQVFFPKGMERYTWHIGTTKTVIYQEHTYFWVALRRACGHDGDGETSLGQPGNDSRHFHKSAVQGEGEGT